MWTTAGIVFVCVAANHLGFVEAVEDILERKFRVISCTKCLTFWSVLSYSLLHVPPTDALAAAFFCAYAAPWVELAMYYIDNLYLDCYGKIDKRQTDNTETPDTADSGDT